MEFGHDFNGIVCVRADLEHGNERADVGIARLARKLLDADADGDVGPANVSARVRQLQVRLLSTGSCSVETVAEQMGVDRRTVHRRLQREGQTYADLFNAVKIELATRYLEDPHRRLASVAELLGYSTLSGFSRWHQAQFGVSASARRTGMTLSRKGKHPSRTGKSARPALTKLRPRLE